MGLGKGLEQLFIDNKINNEITFIKNEIFDRYNINHEIIDEKHLKIYFFNNLDLQIIKTIIKYTSIFNNNIKIEDKFIIVELI